MINKTNKENETGLCPNCQSLWNSHSIEDLNKCRNEKTIKEFEAMRNLAELKALSSLSLERPLTQEKYNRMMELKKEVFGI